MCQSYYKFHDVCTYSLNLKVQSECQLFSVKHKLQRPTVEGNMTGLP